MGKEAHAAVTLNCCALARAAASDASLSRSEALRYVFRVVPREGSRGNEERGRRGSHVSRESSRGKAGQGRARRGAAQGESSGPTLFSSPGRRPWLLRPSCPSAAWARSRPASGAGPASWRRNRGRRGCCGGRERGAARRVARARARGRKGKAGCGRASKRRGEPGWGQSQRALEVRMCVFVCVCARVWKEEGTHSWRRP